MSCRKSRLAVLCLVVVAGALLQSSVFTARAASAEFLPGVGSFEISTDATFALQSSGNHVWPLLAESGFSTPIFDSDLQLRFATSANDDNGAGWDYLWNAAAKIPISAVPEPTTTTLLLAGALLLGGRRLRKKLN